MSTARWQRLRRRVIESASFCALCRGPLVPTARWPHPDSSEVDHRIPRSKGGDMWDPANLQAVHRRCQLAKGDKMPEAQRTTTRDW